MHVWLCGNLAVLLPALRVCGMPAGAVVDVHVGHCMLPSVLLHLLLLAQPGQ